jgi:hypothetical protein
MAKAAAHGRHIILTRAEKDFDVLVATELKSLTPGSYREVPNH